MDEECPRAENSISNRQLLVKELHIEKIMKRNKVGSLKTFYISGFSLGILKHASGTPCLAQFGVPE